MGLEPTTTGITIRATLANNQALTESLGNMNTLLMRRLTREAFGIFPRPPRTNFDFTDELIQLEE